MPQLIKSKARVGPVCAQDPPTKAKNTTNITAADHASGSSENPRRTSWGNQLTDMNVAAASHPHDVKDEARRLVTRVQAAAKEMGFSLSAKDICPGYGMSPMERWGVYQTKLAVGWPMSGEDSPSMEGKGEP